MLPQDDERPNTTSGLRLGFAAVTTRGLTKDGAKETATIIHEFLKGVISKSVAKKRVKELTKELSSINRI